MLFMNLKVADKKCARFVYFTLLYSFLVNQKIKNLILMVILLYRISLVCRNGGDSPLFPKIFKKLILLV